LDWHDPFGAHEGLAIVIARLGILAVASGYYSSEPTEERFPRDFDDSTKAGIVLAMVGEAAALLGPLRGKFRNEKPPGILRAERLSQFRADRWRAVRNSAAHVS
jgi:hypothetical protein